METFEKRLSELGLGRTCGYNMTFSVSRFAKIYFTSRATFLFVVYTATINSSRPACSMGAAQSYKCLVRLLARDLVCLVFLLYTLQEFPEKLSDVISSVFPGV